MKFLVKRDAGILSKRLNMYRDAAMRQEETL